MQSRRAWLPSKNFQAKSASDLARDNGHLVLAGLIEKTCDEIYSQDFIDLQISHILQDKWGSSSSRSLSSLTAQIGSIRALFPGNDSISLIIILSFISIHDDRCLICPSFFFIFIYSRHTIFRPTSRTLRRGVRVGQLRSSSRKERNVAC